MDKVKCTNCGSTNVKRVPMSMSLTGRDWKCKDCGEVFEPEDDEEASSPASKGDDFEGYPGTGGFY